MKSKKRVISLLTVVSSFAMISVCTAEQRPDIARCIENPNPRPDPRRCLYVIRYENAIEYEQPNTKSKTLPSWGWAKGVQIDWSRAKKAPAGWLPTQAGDYNKPIPYGWIEINNLAHLGLDQFKRVTGCWPVASIEDGLGDWSLKAMFTPEGGVLLGNGNRSYVSFTPNVIMIRHSDGGLDVYGYDPTTHRLRQPHTGKEPQKVTHFPPDQLKGCEGGLKLEK
jgi:hypothetical protein